MRPARPAALSKEPKKWAKPQKKRKTQVLKKSISSERQNNSASVFRVLQPTGWRLATSKTNNSDKADEVEQEEEQEVQTDVPKDDNKIDDAEYEVVNEE